MKDRIAHIIRAKNLTAAEFAIRLGIQPSSISHLLSGRNNPSLDFVKKLKETFPEYSYDWIINGVGPMTLSEPLWFSGSAMDSSPSEVRSGMTESTVLDDVFASVAAPQHHPVLTSKSGLKYLVLVYDDNTFEILSPR